MMTPEQLEVWSVVRSINALWTKGRVDELVDHVHPRTLAIAPANRDVLASRDAGLESWRRFTKVANVMSWVEADPRVEFHGNTAIVAYLYMATCEMEGGTVELRGRDMFVLR